MKHFQIKTFSRITGLSVRSLQYYDSINLLKPSYKTPKGYRQYAECDLLRLHQIMVLKLQGYSLKHIIAYLDKNPPNMDHTLGMLEQVITQQLTRLEQAKKITLQSKSRLEAGENVDLAILATALQTMQGLIGVSH